MTNLFSDPIVRLALFYPVFLLSLSVHEAAHGWVAGKFGDPTARFLGRVSLNPLAHIDILGTVILPILAITTGMPVIGWAKPVPVNPYHLRDARKNSIWIAAAGPASNVLMALIFAGLCWAEYLILSRRYFEFHFLTSQGNIPLAIYVYLVFNMGVLINLILAVFNLIPIYPLDGGNILRGVISESMVEAFDKYGRYGMIFIFILFLTGVFKFIAIPIDYLMGAMLPI